MGKFVFRIMPNTWWEFATVGGAMNVGAESSDRGSDWSGGDGGEWRGGKH